MKKIMQNRIFAAIVLLLTLLFAMIGGHSYLPALAATKYSSALEDLQKDTSFNVNDYPYIANDYSIELIQIAESTDDELFVYTYQPCQKTTYLVATDINMSLSESPNGMKVYPLIFVNCSGTLCKYKVKGLTVSTESVRYYNITSISREWNKDIDDGTGNDNVQNTVPYSVGILWKAVTENGEVRYGYNLTETIEITEMYVDHLRYSTGFHFIGFSKCDSHYVAFSTDKKIDKLMEAEVFYFSQSVVVDKTMGIVSSEKRGEEVSQKAVLSEIDSVTVGGGLFAKTYTWNRIQSVSDFIATESLSDTTKDSLQNTKWILRFAETDYSSTGDYKVKQETSTEISRVRILRLKFETDEKVYNLGVVSASQTGDRIPGNTNQNELDFGKTFFSGNSSWWVYLVVFAFAMIVLVVLGFVFPVFGKGLLVVLKWIGIILWQIISLPFKGIAALVQKIKDKKDGG